MRLTELLQHEYSVELYGMQHRMPVADLRIVWTQLLPSRAIALLESAGGACSTDAQPPARPFYWAHDIIANPRGGVWIHRDVTDEPIANNSWVEVTHCAKPSRPNGSILPGGEWVLGPLWAYIAPGSGVSVNVGRTLVLSGYKAARRLLAAAFPFGSNQSCSGGLGSRALADGHPLANVDSLQILDHKECAEPRT